MGRDLHELTTVDGTFGLILVVLFFSLPVASVLALAARRWIAVVPLLGWIALFASWFAYYATDWIGPVSGSAAGLVLLLVLAGWTVLVVALFVPERRAANSTAKGSHQH